MNDDERGLQRELRQARPFRTPAQEATVALLHTADGVRRHLIGALEPYGITLQQFNVLRILRGSHPDPLPTLEIAERMIERQPGITRLLDRLMSKGWVRRERYTADRRLVHCWITDEGLELLRRTDPVVDAADRAAAGSLQPAELEQLIDLLARVRSATR